MQCLQRYVAVIIPEHGRQCLETARLPHRTPNLGAILSIGLLQQGIELRQCVESLVLVLSGELADYLIEEPGAMASRPSRMLYEAWIQDGLNSGNNGITAEEACSRCSQPLTSTTGPLGSWPLFTIH